MLSLVVPVYKNEGSIRALLDAIEKLQIPLEVIFVVDGSPDRSALVLRELLPNAAFSSKLVNLSKNFGAFHAISAGLREGTGQYFAVMAADLQEPPELIERFYTELSSGEGAPDIVFGLRTERNDPLMSQLSSRLFWGLYRRFVNRDVPSGGVDIFACNRRVRDEVIELRERSSSLVALLFWVGFRRSFIPYVRQERHSGKSAWSFRKKWNYLLDSFFSFTNLPIRVLMNLGLTGVVLSVVCGMVILFAKLFGSIDVPGYTATILAVLFFGGLNSLGLGIIGEYTWRTFLNSQERPNFIIREILEFQGVQRPKEAKR